MSEEETEWRSIDSMPRDGSMFRILDATEWSIRIFKASYSGKASLIGSGNYIDYHDGPWDGPFPMDGKSFTEKNKNLLMWAPLSAPIRLDITPKQILDALKEKEEENESLIKLTAIRRQEFQEEREKNWKKVQADNAVILARTEEKWEKMRAERDAKKNS